MSDTETRQINVKKRTGLALALSGGGFRATLFHLGLLRRLNEMDLLRHVEAISSVSGGSITNALLAQTADRWKAQQLTPKQWQDTIRAPLVAFCHHNIRTGPILYSLLRPWRRGEAVARLEQCYQRLLTTQTLDALPTNVDFVFCASDLIFSTMWYYRRKTSPSRRTGNYRAGWVKTWQPIPVARAVAASSCFPPIFGPQVVGLCAEDLAKPSSPPGNWAELVGKLRLTDGGVYDNLGLEPVWDSYRYLICSDGGKPGVSKATRGVGQLMRYSQVMQSQVGALRARMLIQRDKNPSLDFNACLVGIDNQASAGYSRSFVNEIITNIRTDLDSFSDVEACVLENHAYSIADQQIKKYLIPEIEWEVDPEVLNNPTLPHPDAMDESELRARMKHSHRRTLFYFLRPSWL